ncbi:AraC family transcriptional regulator [Pseudomonas fluorescens]|uniref:HTH araC/xylS-type domain-containing protein n=1 Tax=Pseudomonas fluorescens TaxID=294 RepID=A0A0F4T5W5_PSEFL|nr:AraC family transcriptional regulator [Pseudomonas fluorescens]KJZ39370.1 hypothetical protein VC35_25460 [Pseudomonas fluorescens]
MFLLRSGAIEGYGTLVSQLGQNPVSLLRDAGMVVAQLRQPNSYVSYEKTADLLDDTARQCQEPLFALRLASRQDLLAIGDVALSGSRQPTVGEALSFARQLQLLKNQYPDNLKAQVCHLIGGLLHTGECSIEAVSNSLGLQPRVLQKRLQAEGSRFSQLLQETRLEIAKQNLLRDKTSITDLALNLGYADVSVFSRHFKQWTGFSPRNWRAQQTAGD